MNSLLLMTFGRPSLFVLMRVVHTPVLHTGLVVDTAREH